MRRCPVIIFFFFFLFWAQGTFFVEQRVDSERSSCWVLGIAFSCCLLQDLLVFLPANPVSKSRLKCVWHPETTRPLASSAPSIPTSGSAYRIVLTEIRAGKPNYFPYGLPRNPCFFYLPLINCRSACCLLVGRHMRFFAAMSRLGCFVYSAAASNRFLIVLGCESHRG